jgi:hypothetical protein
VTPHTLPLAPLLELIADRSDHSAAIYLGMNVRTVQNWRKGQPTHIRPSLGARYAEALKVAPERIWGDAWEPDPGRRLTKRHSPPSERRDINVDVFISRHGDGWIVDVHKAGEVDPVEYREVPTVAMGVQWARARWKDRIVEMGVSE